VSGAADQVDAGIAAFRESVVPSLEQLDGFRTAVLFADRSAGRLVAMTVWADENAQSASEAAAAPLRSEVADRFGASVEPPALYELLITTVRP
jgi:heme-degrading monooxygenase HmoA